jgi:hypothetical protein
MSGRAIIKNDPAAGKKMPAGVRCAAPANGKFEHETFISSAAVPQQSRL